MVDGANDAASRKTALITGGSSGIGFELTQLFARDGYDLVLAARKPETLRASAGTLEREFGVRVRTVSCDLSEEGAAQRLIDTVATWGIDVDALVNNAGFGIAGSFVKTCWEQQERMLAVNIKALTQLSLHYGALMVARGSGAILNIASIAAFMQGPYMATYYASKSYVLSFTRALHTELAPFGVKVSALCPPPTKTNFFYAAGFGGKSVFNHAAMPARFVARAGYCALKANRAQCNPGLFTKATSLATRVLPRGVMGQVIRVLQAPSAHAADKRRDAGRKAKVRNEDI